MKPVFYLVLCLLAAASLHGDSIAKFEEKEAASKAKATGLNAYLAALPEGNLEKFAREFWSIMPEQERKKLSAQSLAENQVLAEKARAQFAWGESYGDDIFVQHVLPYANLDETREDWRAEFYQICSEIVEDATTTGEAAQALNRELFNKINVHYNTDREKSNQSIAESVRQSRATCTGLSIILANGCRAVGVPARLVGTPLWSDESGNHTWVEVLDEGEWKFLGADEYDEKGLNRAWFTDRASQAEPGMEHGIFAVAWGNEDVYFPMAWAPEDKRFGAVDVTTSYLENAVEKEGTGVRIFAGNGERVEAGLALVGPDGKELAAATSKAGTADLNDVARLSFEGEGPWELTVQYGEQTLKQVFATAPTETIDIRLVTEQTKSADKIVEEWEKSELSEREAELEAKLIEIGDYKLRFLEKKFGEEPEAGHALWISMHGGGGTTAEVNDRQWQNQIKLYEPAEGYYVAPRSPTNTWNMWHQVHVDDLFDRLIENYVIARGVDPNRIYLLGYSAGGDGVYQLAPRMADRFAAAAMMAGHPNETKPDGLRNLSFELFMGSEDAAYDRNKHAETWKTWLKEYAANDEGGYPHRATIYEGLGHWMDGKDKEALPRMIQELRQEWPKKVVWLQDDVTHDRFYWMGVKPGTAERARKLVGEVEGQTIKITGDDVSGLELWLSDELIDLSEDITIELNGKKTEDWTIKNGPEVVEKSLEQRQGMVATHLLTIP